LKKVQDKSNLYIYDSSREKYKADSKSRKPDKLLIELEQLKKKSVDEPSESELQERNKIAEKLLKITQRTYDKICKKYSILRGEEPDERNRDNWDRIIKIAKSRINFLHAGNSSENLTVLDIGTGYGRDIKYASKIPGLTIIGIDNSDGFIEILKKLEEKKEIPVGSYRKADMRDLSCFPDCSFDIVRYHASLLHLPVIGKGYMADKALSEGYRVLKKNGIVYISVKKGNSLKFVDTQEGLGRILYQFHTKESILLLLKRNNFKLVLSPDGVEQLWEILSSRGKHISWICLIAEKA
jgi:ubiquinone/menaquinone biosynthesis C-methylase UbiE